ncbi:2OG-Fe(II) oxygenase [Aquimarina rhabdastrellae]
MYTSYKINDLLVVEIENFLSNEELNEILIPRKLQFEKAISHYPKYYRNNDRLVEDNKDLSHEFFQKLKNIQILNTEDKIVGLNERFRFCRYQKNQSFSKHQDGIYYPNAKEESKYTFLLYLNDHKDFNGGTTEFYTSKTDTLPIKSIIPKKGKLVIFDHQLWHKGAKVTHGNKYILRSDILIKSNPHNTHHQGYIWNLLKLNDEQFLSCGRDRKIKRWNTSLSLQHTIEVHSNSVLKMVSLNQNEYISCSRDFTIKKWNLSGDVHTTIHLNEMILNLACTSNNLIIATGTSGKIYVLNSTLDILKIIKVHDSWIWGLSLLSDTKILSCCEKGKVYLTNILSEETTCIYKHNYALFCLCTKKKNTIFLGSKDGTLIELCMITQKVLKTKLHTDIIRSIIYHNEHIISCGEDNKVISIHEKHRQSKTLFVSNNFLQNILVIKNILYAAGYDGSISKIRIA